MSYTRPGKVDPKDVQSNGKLYDDGEIQALKDIIAIESGGSDKNIFVPRSKKYAQEYQYPFPFSVAQMDGKLYAIYKGVKQGKHLGQGAFGTVKVAQDLDSGEWVALKILRENDPSLEHEVMLNGIANNASGAVYNRESPSKGVVQQEFILPLAHGEEMAKLFIGEEAQARFSFSDKTVAALALVKAYQDLHSKGILHCDIKLENLHYDTHTKKVTVLDFGLSLLADSENQALHRGSPFSIPPEIKLGKMNTYSTVTEVYGIGVALADIYGFELIEDTKRHMAKNKNSIYLPLPHGTDDAKNKVIDIINSAIKVNPDLRPTTAEIIEKLNAVKLQIEHANKPVSSTAKIMSSVPPSRPVPQPPSVPAQKILSNPPSKPLPLPPADPVMQAAPQAKEPVSEGKFFGRTKVVLSHKSKTELLASAIRFLSKISQESNDVRASVQLSVLEKILNEYNSRFPESKVRFNIRSEKGPGAVFPSNGKSSKENEDLVLKGVVAGSSNILKTLNERLSKAQAEMKVEVMRQPRQG